MGRTLLRKGLKYVDEINFTSYFSNWELALSWCWIWKSKIGLLSTCKVQTAC